MKNLVSPVSIRILVLLSLLLSMGCNSHTANKDEFADYEHAVSSNYAFASHPQFQGRSAEWTLYYNLTEQGSMQYRDKFQGVLSIEGHKVLVKGSHYNIFDGHEYKCGQTLPNASNSVVLQTEFMNDNFRPTDGTSGQSHFTTFYFSNGLEGPALIICSNAIDNLSDTNPWFGSANRNFERIR